MFCTNCGKEQVGNPRFCRNCGAELGSSANKIMAGGRSRGEVIQPEVGRIFKWEEPIRAHLQTYTDEANGISISYPEGWGKIEKVLLGFQASKEEYGYTAKFNLTYGESPQASLEAYFTTIKKIIRGLKNYAAISEERLIIDGIPAIKHVYTFSEKKIPVQAMLVCLVEGKVGWWLVLSSAAGFFNSYQTTFNAVASSIHFSEANRGKQAAAKFFTPVIKRDIRGWGIGILIMGIISIFVPFFDPVWGVILIIAGIIELIAPHRAFYIVNGILLIIVSILNITSGFVAWANFWVVLGVFQFIWGINELRKFGKYRL